MFYLIDSDKPWSHSTVNNPYDRSDNRVAHPPENSSPKQKFSANRIPGNPVLSSPVLKHRYQRGKKGEKRKKKRQKEKNTRKSENRLKFSYSFRRGE